MNGRTKTPPLTFQRNGSDSNYYARNDNGSTNMAFDTKSGLAGENYECHGLLCGNCIRPTFHPLKIGLQNCVCPFQFHGIIIVMITQLIELPSGCMAPTIPHAGWCAVSTRRAHLCLLFCTNKTFQHMTLIAFHTLSIDCINLFGFCVEVYGIF